MLKAANWLSIIPSIYLTGELLPLANGNAVAAGLVAGPICWAGSITIVAISVDIYERLGRLLARF